MTAAALKNFLSSLSITLSAIDFVIQESLSLPRSLSKQKISCTEFREKNTLEIDEKLV